MKKHSAERSSPQDSIGDKTIEVLTFDRTDLLPAVFGEFDVNLVAIENRTSVLIHARGNRITIEGNSSDVQTARRLLEALFEKARNGHEIHPDAIGYELSRIQDVTMEDGAVVAPFVTIKTRRKTISPRTPAQASYMQQLARSEMLFAIGPAGTGKTYLAVAQAVADLISGKVERLILSRPAVEAGERLGFLPGDMKEKVDPYLRPIYDALHDCLPPEQVERRIASGEIEVAPIAFMRGRTLANAFIILDEAQNTTREQMKMFLTRFGEGSRMVICGDPKQVDIPGGPKMSGLVDAMERLERVDGIGFAHFNADDVVRHAIVGKVVQAYEG